MFPFSGTGLVGVLALTLLAGCTGSRQSQPQSNDTRINETSFRLTLPGLWKSGSAGDPTRRDYHTDNEQLTVSIFGSLFGKPGTMEHTARVTTFRRWVNKRRDIEGRLPGLANVTTTEPTFAEIRGTMAARYEGNDPTNNRRFHCLMLANSAALETFYYEAVNMTESRVTDRAKAIFNSVNIPE